MSETATILELLVEQRGTVPWLIIQRQEPLSSARALEYGLVNYVDNDVDARLDWLLQQLLDKSPAAIRRGLYTMKKIEDMPFEESVAFAESQIALFTLTEDAKEGQQAFQQKRKPQWKGK